MDGCPYTLINDTAFLDRMAESVTRGRVPAAGSIDLTHRCNLRCVHCYAGAARCGDGGANELTTGQWHAIIDDITAAGCLFLLLSGGEPLLRPDFPGIYTHAKLSGLLVTVFTNGTLVSDSVAALFADLPPHGVEVSVYGATAAVYERVTGVAGSYRRCMNGIDRLAAAGVRYGLKTILMTLNAEELTAMRAMADARGVDFRFDPAIFPRLDGDKGPIDLRVDPQLAVACELDDPEALRQWADYYDTMKDCPVLETLYGCGTGQSAFHIDPAGFLQPCLLVDSPRYDLKSGSFMEGWEKVIPAVRQRRAGAGFGCNACPKRVLCGMCPAFFRLENGDEESHSPYLCALGTHRLERILEYRKGEDRHDRQG
ncbi:MAG: radical SAM protein [Pseudomonadota bacterium]